MLMVFSCSLRLLGRYLVVFGSSWVALGWLLVAFGSSWCHLGSSRSDLKVILAVLVGQGGQPSRNARGCVKKLICPPPPRGLLLTSKARSSKK